MKIYTKTGDAGETSLYGGERLPKDSTRIEAYGSVDELNSVLGVVRSLVPSSGLREDAGRRLDGILHLLQRHLFAVGADLAAPASHEKKPLDVPRIAEENVAALEALIDELDAELPPLRTFILPGGIAAASHLHLARTVCRRAERLVVSVNRSEGSTAAIMKYLNRLSDLLFVMARWANHAAEVDEEKWSAR